LLCQRRVHPNSALNVTKEALAIHRFERIATAPAKFRRVPFADRFTTKCRVLLLNDRHDYDLPAALMFAVRMDDFVDARI
jgi:hypothetical protein